jgi:prevent-host-death family protein
MNTVTANELKIKGVSAVEACLETEDEVIITVRGQHKYVVLDMEKYAKLREYELEIAVNEARVDMVAGKYDTETAAEHIKRIRDGV